MDMTMQRRDERKVPLRFPCERSAAWKLPKHLAIQAAGRLAVALNGMLGSRAGGALGILMYHRVACPAAGLPAPLYNVTPRRLREQLTGLLQRGYQFWSLSEALAHGASGAPFPSQTALVTFDDGYATTHAHACPILRELGVPATVFLNTAYLDHDAPFPFDAWGTAHHASAPVESYRPLTTTECRDLLESGLIDIGAHTHTHADFRGHSSMFRDDVQTSVDIIQSRFGVREVPFAFPYGGRDTGFAGDDLADAARQTGVSCGLTTEPSLVDPAADPFRWGRFNVFSWDTDATLGAKLAGWYSWAPKVKRCCVAFGRSILEPRRSILPFTNRVSG